MTAQQPHRQLRDPWAAPEAQGISVRTTLVALVIAFLGIVILGALLVDETPMHPDRKSGERPPAAADLPDNVVNRGFASTETLLDFAGETAASVCGFTASA